MWKRADQVDPTCGSSPTDYGWKLTENSFEPDWYPGSSLPESLTDQPSDDRDRAGPASIDDEDDSDGDSAWSEESEDQSDE